MLHISKGKVAISRDPRIAALFPSAREITLQGNKLLVIPHDYHATRYLRSLGHDVPAPVLEQYHWPHPFGQAPYDVQKKTVALMTMERRAYCLNAMGCGKTRCTLWAYDFLRSQGLAKKLLIVAKLSTVTVVWAKEIFEVFPHLRVMVLTGTKERRLKRLAEDADCYVVNQDGVGTIHDDLMARTDIDVLAIDELSAYRNARSTRSKLIQKLAARMEWVWGLTGSPIPRSPTDVYGQCKIITPWTVPKSFNMAREMLCWKAGAFRWEPKDNAVEKAMAMMAPAVRYSLDDIVELPELTYRYVEVPLGAKQKKAYAAMKATSVSLVEGKQIDALNAGAALSKLLQIAGGWVYTRDGQTVTLDNDERVDVVVDSVEEATHKVIVFVPFKSALQGLSAAFEKAEIEHATISGDTSKGNRDEIFSAFQNTGKFKAIIAHPAAMAHGLTLTAADTIIWAGPVADLEIFQQANARITRLGQQHKQLVLMIGGTPAEKRIYQSLANKEAIQNKFLDLLQADS